jgi:hypothetical protein
LVAPGWPLRSADECGIVVFIRPAPDHLPSACADGAIPAQVEIKDLKDDHWRW